MKTVLVLKGSPRERGNSAMLAEQAALGAQKAGASVESVYLHGLDIRPCDPCDECCKGKCIIDDDMQSLYPRISAADVIIFATPVYWFTYSAQLKLCIDRMYAYQATKWKDASGKVFGIILTYGDVDLETSGGINALRTFETMARFLKSEIGGFLHASLSNAGDAEKHPDLMQQAFDMGRKLGAE